MTGPLTVCSTKKLKSSVIRLLKKNGLEVFFNELINVTYKSDEETQSRVRAVRGSIAITSRHGVKGIVMNAGGNLSGASELFCLSGETQKAALKLNVPIRATAGNATSLAAEIIKAGTKTITYFCADNHRPELPQILSEKGIRVNKVIVYSSSLNFVKIDRHIDFLLFFSPRSVEAFLQTNLLSTDVICFCLGETTATFLRKKISNVIITADSPSQEHLAQTVINFVNSRKI